MDPYTAEFRGEVLAACDANEGTRVVALRFEVSESWVRRIKQQRRETGQVAPKTAAPRQPKWQAWADSRQIRPLIDPPCGHRRRTHEVVNRPHRDRDPQHLRQQRHRPAIRTVTTEDQGQHQPPNQTTGDRNPEQDPLVRVAWRVGGVRLEGLLDRLPRELHLRPDKLATDPFVPSRLSGRTTSRQHPQSQLAPLPRLQRLGPTRAGWQSHYRQLRIVHVCFLPETELGFEPNPVSRKQTFFPPQSDHHLLPDMNQARFCLSQLNGIAASPGLSRSNRA